MGNVLWRWPAHKEDREMLPGVLSHVEAIPLEAIQGGSTGSWETIPEYLDALDQRLGINVAALIGHSAVRRYVMVKLTGTARTDDEVTAMKAIVREGWRPAPWGLLRAQSAPFSIGMAGWHRPNLASEERSSLSPAWADEVGGGVIQFWRRPRYQHEASEGQPAPGFSTATLPSRRWRRTNGASSWEKRELDAPGTSRLPVVMPRPGDLRYTTETAQHFDAMATWKNVMLLPHDLRTQASAIRNARQAASGGPRDARWIPTAPAIHAPLGFAVRIQARAGEKPAPHGQRAWPRSAGNRIKTYSTLLRPWR